MVAIATVDVADSAGVVVAQMDVRIVDAAEAIATVVETAGVGVLNAVLAVDKVRIADIKADTLRSAGHS